MGQKQSTLYQFIFCLVGIISILISVSAVDVFPHNSIFNSSVMNLVFVHVAVFYWSDFSNRFFNGGMTREFYALAHYLVQFFFVTTMILFIDKSMTVESRSKLVYMIILHGILMYGLQKIGKKLRWHYLQHLQHKQSVMLVTTQNRLEMIANRMKKKGEWGGQITSILIVDVVDRSQVVLPSYFEGAARVDMVTFEKFITRQVVDEVFIHLDASFDLLVTAILPKFEEAGIDVNVNITAFDISSNIERKIDRFASFSVIKFSSKFYNYNSVIIKRLIDIVFSIIGLILTMPIAIVLIPMIKLDSKGPAIFAQNRVGKNGRIFKFYKFRSMVVNAEELKEKLMAQNEMDGHMFKMEDDPRVTKIGKFIRKTSIDELPQFFNILMGDMSLVGTRPPTVEEYEQYNHKQKKRLSLKPGITGLWQVSGRSEITDFDEVVRLDIEYIDNWSLKMDLKIILKTFRIVLLGRGAK